MKLAKHKNGGSVYDRHPSLCGMNDSFSKIYPLVPSNSRILDVGCANGALSELLYENKNCEIYGMDINTESIKKAKDKKVFSALHQVDLNTLKENDFSEYRQFFDCIICADVLEHLNNPLSVLQILCSFLKSDGNIIISIPNVAHASIKANLLLNDWTYTKIGILDETHLRFFTANSLPDFFQKSGLEIVELQYTKLPPDGYQPHCISELPTAVSAFILRDAHSHIQQYICCCRLSKRTGVNLKKYNTKFFDEIKTSVSKTEIKDRVKRFILTRCPSLTEKLMALRNIWNKGLFR